MARRLQNRKMTGQVGALVGERLVDRIANARLGGEVHDPLGAAVGDQRREGLMVRDVEADHGEARSRFQPRRPRRLERGIVVVDEGIDAYDGFPTIKQAVGRVSPDEPGRAGDDDGHGPPSLRPAVSCVQCWHR